MARPTLPAAGSTGWDTGLASAIYDVSDRADTALATTAAPVPGVVLLDSFAGSTDDAKLDAALSYAAAQTRIPAVLFSGRSYVFNTGARTPFTGMKLYGPYGAAGPKNLEIASGAPVNHKVTLNTGTGTSAWFNGTVAVYDVMVSGLAFQGGAGAQFWSQPSGTLYACQFDTLTFYGFGSVFGNATTKALVTQVLFTGHWTCLSFSGTQFHIGGSDCQLWRGGYLNIQAPTGQSLGGMPLLWFDTLQKTDVGYIYATCVSDTVGLRVSGNSGLTLFGGTYEGVNASSPSTRGVVDVQGGAVALHGSRINFVNAASSGAVTQSGGDLTLADVNYMRASTVDQTYPLLYQTGGSAQARRPKTMTAGESIRLRWSDATTTDYTPSNKSVI